MRISLKFGEHLVAVIPESCSGPGWVNKVIWVHIADQAGKMRTVALQPDEQNDTLRALFEIGEAVHKALVEAVYGIVDDGSEKEECARYSR